MMISVTTSASSRMVSTNATKVKRNANFDKLQAGYLFPEIARRRYYRFFPSMKI